MINDNKKPPVSAKRLRKARKNCGFKTVTEVTRHFGWNYATYLQHEAGKRNFDRHCEKYAEAFNVSASWLLTGEGRGPDDSTEMTRGTGVYKLIPEYDVVVSAGHGEIIEQENIKAHWPFDPQYLSSELKVQAAHIALVEVRGDSMEPTLSSGDRVMVNTLDIQVSQPGIFVLWNGNGTVIKRVEVVLNRHPVHLVLISDNDCYSRYEVPAQDIKVIGRVVWASRRM